MTKKTLQEISDQLYQRAKDALERGEIPVSCCLLTEDGQKYYSSNKVEEESDPLAHAEILLIEQVLKEKKVKYLKNSVLIVTLEPCLMCLGAILKANIKSLYYFLDDEKKGGLSYYHTFVDDVLEVTRLHDDRFLDLMKECFSKLRN